MSAGGGPDERDGARLVSGRGLQPERTISQPQAEARTSRDGAEIGERSRRGRSEP